MVEKTASTEFQHGSPRFSLRAILLLVTLAAIAGGVLYWLGSFSPLKEQIRANIGPHLKRIHQPLDQFLDSLPMWVAQACAIGLFAAAAIFTWCLPRRFVYLGAPDNARWRDLRIWATLILVPYMVIYLILGL